MGCDAYSLSAVHTHSYVWVVVHVSRQRDFQAKAMCITGRGRCINAEVFSYCKYQQNFKISTIMQTYTREVTHKHAHKMSSTLPENVGRMCGIPTKTEHWVPTLAGQFLHPHNGRQFNPRRKNAILWGSHIFSPHWQVKCYSKSTPWWQS